MGQQTVCALKYAKLQAAHPGKHRALSTVRPSLGTSARYRLDGVASKAKSTRGGKHGGTVGIPALYCRTCSVKGQGEELTVGQIAIPAFYAD